MYCIYTVLVTACLGPRLRHSEKRSKGRGSMVRSGPGPCMALSAVVIEGKPKHLKTIQNHHVPHPNRVRIESE